MMEVARAQNANPDRAFRISWSKVVDERVFLIHLFKLVIESIEALAKTAVLSGGHRGEYE
jgi:hypothetical protein